MEFFVTFEE